MKNLKPSKLPEGTLIDDDRYGEHLKRADGVWEDMERDNLGDRQRVTDAGYIKGGKETYPEFLRRTGLAHSEKSDDYFKNYKVIAVPPWFGFMRDAEMIHGSWVDALGGYADGTRQHDCRGYNCEA